MTPPAALAAVRTDAPIFKAEGLTRRFGGLTAVRDFSFAIYPGEILGLIGSNGAGKSTTFNVISGYFPPSAGRMYFRGEEITGLSAVAISRRGLVRTFQHQSLLKTMTVHDNILLGTLKSEKTQRARLDRVHQTAELLGLRDVLGEIAGRLSHGRQRILSIAIAFAARPLMLCLDEPLTGLNSTEIRTALHTVRHIRDTFGTTLLLVDHNMRAVMQICDRIIVLNHGVFLAEGTPAEIGRNPDVIRAYLGESH